MLALKQVGNENEVYLVWIPGQKGIEGNEKVAAIILKLKHLSILGKIDR